VTGIHFVMKSFTICDLYEMEAMNDKDAVD
jgi:hypothetical protein